MFYNVFYSLYIVLIRTRHEVLVSKSRSRDAVLEHLNLVSNKSPNVLLSPQSQATTSRFTSSFSMT